MNGSIDCEKIVNALNPVCRKFGGECQWRAPDGWYGKFMLKRDTHTRRDLLLAFKREVFVSLYSHKESLAGKTNVVRLLKTSIPDGTEVAMGVVADYCGVSKSPSGVLVRFKFRDIDPSDFERRIEEVSIGVAAIMERLDKINAFAL